MAVLKTRIAHSHLPFVWLWIVSKCFFDSGDCHAVPPELIQNECNELAADAISYQGKIQEIFSSLAQQQKIPICFREPSFAAQARQFQGYFTKPKEVTAKSSNDPRIAGFIPCNQSLSKLGKKLHLTQEIEKATGNIKELLKNSRYTCKPFLATGIEVLNFDNNPITADLDLFLVGNHGGNHKDTTELVSNPELGKCSVFESTLINAINQKWHEMTTKTNHPVKHGPEIRWVQNPIDDIYWCWSALGVLSKFDLRSDVKLEPVNQQRQDTLRNLGQWIANEETTSLHRIKIPLEIINDQQIKKDYTTISEGKCAASRSPSCGSLESRESTASMNPISSHVELPSPSCSASACAPVCPLCAKLPQDTSVVLNHLIVPEGAKMNTREQLIEQCKREFAPISDAPASKRPRTPDEGPPTPDLSASKKPKQ